MKSIINTISIDNLKTVCTESYSIKEVLKKLGFTAFGGNNYKKLHQRIIDNNIDISHFTSYSKLREISKKDMFTENSSYCTSTVKKKIIKENILEYVCSECKNKGWWNGKQLTLHLDHKNGINNDNRLENLRFLCPNCHSQTETYTGKNIKCNKPAFHYCKICEKKISKSNKTGLCADCLKNKNKKQLPNKTDLLNELLKFTFSDVAKRHNISIKLLKKWCKEYSIPSNYSDLKLLKGYSVKREIKTVYNKKSLRKLSSDQVSYIRECYKNNTKTMRYLAKEFNISRRSISNIIKRNTYRDIP